MWLLVLILVVWNASNTALVLYHRHRIARGVSPARRAR